MSKHKSKHYWNYRIVTKLIPGPMGHDLDKGTTKKLPDTRVFSIVEVFYTDGKPDSYIESKSILSECESVKDLKWIRKKIKKAFKKPILDLDNWPKKYYPKQVLVTNDIYS